MEYRKFDNTYIVRLDPGEEILEQVKVLSLKEGIQLATVQGLGAVNDLTLGIFKPDEKKYYANSFQGYYEIVSLTGTVSTIYWLVATAIYLGCSFITNDWKNTWIVWPIAGVLFAAVMAVCHMLLENSRKK